MIFKSCIENSVFLNEWKKANVIPIHKKKKKKSKNYRPASLLPICGKFFEQLIYNNLFSHQ